jgi:hypothetical protein
MFLGPHVGAQYPCTCPPLAIKGEACNVTRQADLETQGLFGWAVAVEKVAVGCELWKKLL